MRYINLIGEMAKRRVSVRMIADLLGIHQNSVRQKINGKTKFYVDEAIAIRNAFFPEKKIEELFETEEE